MDSQTTSSAMSGISAAMLPQATIEKAERSQFHNTGRDTIKVELNNYNFNKEEFSDPIDYVRSIAQLVVAEVRKNNRSQSPVDETPSADGSGLPSQAVTADHTPTSSNPERDVVDISDIVPPDPSCLPVTSIADRYTRSMLKCFVGYPLYEPQPFSEFSKEYLRLGINVGDVGFVRGNGRFDFLFNICPSHSEFNPPQLPKGFSLETSEPFGTEAMRPLPRNTRFFQSPITRTKFGEYICRGPEGAVLELPEGALEERAINMRPFKELAKRHGVQWYKYTMDRGRDISNGSLYLITSFTKCSQWGLAAFDRPCLPGQGLKFETKRSLFHLRSTSKYHWKGSNPSSTKVSNLDKKDAPNQSVFLRGYKIMIRQDIFDNLCNDQPRRSGSATPSSSTQAASSNRIKAHRIRGGGGTDPISKRLSSGSLLGRTTATTARESDHVILHANFNSSLVHPSDFINSALLSQNPGAKVALTHDDVWCDLLQDNFPKLDCAKLTNIAHSYMSTVDEDGCVFLEKLSGSNDDLNESDHLVHENKTPAPQEPIQDVRNKHDPDIPILAQASTALQPLSIDHSPRDGDEGNLKISVPAQAPHTTLELHTPRDRDSESRANTSVAQPTTDHPSKEANNEDNHDIPTPVILSRDPPIDVGSEDVQSTETGDGEDADFRNPKVFGLSNVPDESICSLQETETPVLERPTERKSATLDGDYTAVPAEITVPIVQTTNDKVQDHAILYEFQGDAVIFQFGDGQYSEAEKDLIRDHISNGIAFKLPNINDIIRKHSLNQSIITLPHPQAAYSDYSKKKHFGLCFKGTRESLLQEIADWVSGTDETRMYLLSGLAGIGKSTVAYTVAARADEFGLLGASYFFSRDEDDCNNARMFFAAIAYQLCLYSEPFAQAIEAALLTEQVSTAATRSPQEQLEALILKPLQGILQSRVRPILIIVDALDECDEDGLSILSGLTQLVQDLPSFKVILTTRPQPHINRFLGSHNDHKIFYLQDIEDNVIDSDIQRYLKHSLSQEQVRAELQDPTLQWCASDNQIESLVQVAGGLFIIAAAVVRFILDRSASNPEAQLKQLLHAFAHGCTPFKDLDHFYSVIFRNVVSADGDNRDEVDRYQLVVGAILFIQCPLPVTTLAHLIDIDVEYIRAVLDNLQSVILLGDDDVPHIYHKSFSNYVTDSARCKDNNLCIDPRLRHTQITTRCFRIMGQGLKNNILGFSDPAQFMSNEDGLVKDKITDKQLQEKIPQQLRYACRHWANHLEVANVEDADLIKESELFADQHMLHWFEVLSLIGELDSAHHAIRVALKRLKSMSADLRQLLLDGLRFISKFYETIKPSALHTYYTALAFTPTDSVLYRRYINGAIPNICHVVGGPAKWDILVAQLRHEEPVRNIQFSLDGTMLASRSSERDRFNEVLKIWDAVTGTPISAIRSSGFAIANDFSTIASFKETTIILYNVNGSEQGTPITTMTRISQVTISFESSRIAAILSDGTVCLWDGGNRNLIGSYPNGSYDRSSLQFSDTGARLAYVSTDGVVTLRDAIDGRFIAKLDCGLGVAFSHNAFSGDGSRIATLSWSGLRLWSCDKGDLVGVAKNAGSTMALSSNGSLLATGTLDKVKLWSGSSNPLSLVRVLDLGRDLYSMAFSPNDTLAITTDSDIKLYDVKNGTLLSALSFAGNPLAPVAFSLDCSRLAAGNSRGAIYLWDIPSIEMSSPSNKQASGQVTALALSLDCSQVACGFADGAIELWETDSLANQRFAAHGHHPEGVRTLGFSPDGRRFASGSRDGLINVWEDEDMERRRALQYPTKSGWLFAVEISNNVLAAAGDNGLVLWDPNTGDKIHTFEGSFRMPLSFSDNGVLLATVRNTPPHYIIVFDITKHTTIAGFSVPNQHIRTAAFLPDNSQLVVQSFTEEFLVFSLDNKEVIQRPTINHFIQLHRMPLWYGFPVWVSMKGSLMVSFSQYDCSVPVLWIPREFHVHEWTQGRSMIALGCEDGGVVLLRLPTNLVL